MFKSNIDTYYNDIDNVLKDIYYNDTNNILNEIHHNNTNIILFITIYVDNLSLFRLKQPVIDNLKDLLKSEFKVIDLGDLHWLLEI